MQASSSETLLRLPKMILVKDVQPVFKRLNDRIMLFHEPLKGYLLIGLPELARNNLDYRIIYFLATNREPFGLEGWKG